MGANDLGEGLVPFLRKPGDPALNPTGKHEQPLERMRRQEFKNALRRELHEPCTRPGMEHMTWLRATLLGLLNAAVDVRPWAVKEVLNRAYGRTPITVEAKVELDANSAPDLSMDEVLARLDALRDEARALLAVDAEPIPEPASGSVPDVIDTAENRIADEPEVKP